MLSLSKYLEHVKLYYSNEIVPVSLSNSTDIVANSVSVITGNKVIDLLLTIEGITGLPPDTLNSLEKNCNGSK